MKTISIYFDKCYTEEHNAAMRYIVTNLAGVTILTNVGYCIVAGVTDEAFNAISALCFADCLIMNEGAEG